jgi:isopentenyl diphosphate isomerase/L-lactate dehydrogenase-like FMN-dependent dehydrogenase
MEVLPEMVDAVAGRAKVIVDGSFCRGTDIIKAIAVGADLVGLGRMQCFALAAGGEAAIVRMLELLEDEVQRSLGLLGVTTFAQLNRMAAMCQDRTFEPAAKLSRPSIEKASRGTRD